MAQGSRDAYHVLQIHPSAVPEVVEAAYRALAMLHHPDLSKQPDAVSAMAELNAAYTTLRNPELRAAYDKTRVAIPVAAPGGSLSERVHENVAAAAREHERPGHAKLDFGRYAGMTLGEVVRLDPEYLDWLKRHSSGVRYRHEIDELQTRMAARRA
jgi:curved DNA-binding protein CbpA